MSEARRDEPAALLYDQFLATSRTAIDAGLFEAAFHGLSAATHCADVLGDVARIHEIERIADKTQDQIDSEKPDHRIGSKSAADRGQQPLFRTLMLHTQAMAARIRGTGAVAAAAEVSRAERNRRGHTQETPAKESGGNSTD